MSATPDGFVDRCECPHLKARQRDLIEGSMRIVDRDGAEGLTMRSIAAELSLSPMAAYKHFGNQRDLLLEVWRACMRQLTRWVELDLNANKAASPLERFMGIQRSALAYAQRYPRRFQLLFATPLVYAAREERGLDDDRVGLWKLTMSLLENAANAGEVRRDLDIEQLQVFAFSAVQGLALSLMTDRVRAMTQLQNGRAVDGVLQLIEAGLRAAR